MRWSGIHCPRCKRKPRTSPRNKRNWSQILSSSSRIHRNLVINIKKSAIEPSSCYMKPARRQSSVIDVPHINKRRRRQVTKYDLQQGRGSNTYFIVSEMERSTKFYKDVLGLPIKSKSKDWTEFFNTETVLALHPARKVQEQPTP